MKFEIGCGCAVLWCSAVVGFGQTSLNAARGTLEQWVEARQLVSRTKSDWEADREVLEQTLAMFERELLSIKEQLATVSTNNAQAAKERELVSVKQDELNAAGDNLKGIVTGLEQKLLQVAPRFPQPLTDRVMPLLKRIPSDPATTRATTGERLQTLVGVLNEADKFNGSVNVVSEIQKNPAGAEVQVETLYVGLAQAYFVDKAGAYAGFGKPAAHGWTWTERNELAPAVRKCIAIYNNSQPATFVSLPVQIQ